MTAPELAAYLRISARQLRYLIQDGKIPIIRVGKKAIRFRREDVDEALRPKADA